VKQADVVSAEIDNQQNLFFNKVPFQMRSFFANLQINIPYMGNDGTAPAYSGAKSTLQHGMMDIL